MILLNFSHPITEKQQSQLEAEVNEPIRYIYDIPCHFDNARPFAGQVSKIVDSVPLSSQEWQSSKLLINPPGYAPAAATLIAELHGRMGYFPTLIRIRPVTASNPPEFEIAEVIPLRTVREEARKRR